METKKAKLFKVSRLCALVFSIAALAATALHLALGALADLGANEAASIAIIGGADGPTAIFVAERAGYAPTAVAALTFAAAALISLAVMFFSSRKSKRG